MSYHKPQSLWVGLAAGIPPSIFLYVLTLLLLGIDFSEAAPLAIFLNGGLPGLFGGWLGGLISRRVLRGGQNVLIGGAIGGGLAMACLLGLLLALSFGS